MNIISQLTLLLTCLSQQSKGEYKGIKGISFNSILDLFNTESTNDYNFPSPTDAWNTQTTLDWIRMEESNDTNFPSVICNANPSMHGRERKYELIAILQIPIRNIVTIFNTKSQSCFLCYSNPTPWFNNKYSNDIMNQDHITIQPLSYSIKMMEGSVDLIDNLLKDGADSGRRKIIENEKNVILDVVLCPGVDDDSFLNETSSNTTQTNTTDRKLQSLSEIQQEILKTKLLSNNVSYDDTLFWRNDTTFTNERITFWNNALKDNKCNSNEFNFSFSVIANGEDVNTTSHLISIKIDNSNCIYSSMLSLSLLNEVCMIQARPVFQTKNHNAQWLIQTIDGSVGYTPMYKTGMDGSGEVVAVSDTGLDMNHCYFEDLNGNFSFGLPHTVDITRRKVIQYDDYVDSTDVEYGHGTHVSGSIAGCKSDGTGVEKGIAYGAKLAFIDIGDSKGSLHIPDVTRILSTGYPYAKIHSAAWGSNYPGYGAISHFIDAYTFSNDELLVFVPGGNNGDAQSVGEPATAKNVIAVGASQSFGSDIDGSMKGPAYMADFSSRGPTLDGRTKPDIIAPGQWIASAGAGYECDAISPGPGESNSGLTSKQGTSMSTAIAAASAALIRQYLKSGYYPSGETNSKDSISNPSASLIKAILLNGGQEVKDGEMYDSIQNFGRISLMDSLYIKYTSNVHLKLWDRMVLQGNNADSYNINIDMSSGCEATTFTATLVWTDPPGAPGCANCVINDLDLFILKNSITHYPNGLQDKDSKNNVERVRIPNIQDGDELTIYVESSASLSDQTYSLVATGCFSGGTTRISTSSSSSTNVFSDEYNENAEEEPTLSIVILSIIISISLLLVICVIMGIIYCMNAKKNENPEDEIKYLDNGQERSAISRRELDSGMSRRVLEDGVSRRQLSHGMSTRQSASDDDYYDTYY